MLGTEWETGGWGSGKVDEVLMTIERTGKD